MRTGLFAKRISERSRTDGLSYLHQGCRYTYYAESMDMNIGYGATLFDMFHGYCYFFAKYLEKKIGGDVMCMVDKNGRIVHAFLKTRKDGIDLFCDARGMTDNKDEFFAEFDLSEVVGIEKDTDEFEMSWFNASYKNAYKLIFSRKEENGSSIFSEL